eukprot:2668975-Rhodomonas_salina.2
MKEAIAAAVDNGKSLETDVGPLTSSTQMVKAAGSNVVILTAQAINAQVGWADLPVPFASFSDILMAAGGQLLLILHLQGDFEGADASAAETMYRDKLQQSADVRAQQEHVLWVRIHDMCRAHNINLPEALWEPLRTSARADHSCNAALTSAIASLPSFLRKQAATSPFCGHTF